MSYSLEDFCSDTRGILKEQDDHEGRERVRQHFERLLRDEAFCAQYLGEGSTHGVRQIHEDPEQGFCVLVYHMPKPRVSPPHDHGGSWAIYGQVSGYTDMTVWAEAEPGSGRVEPVRRFRLGAGEAGLFDTREIHSIDHPADAKFVRVTGVDMAREPRRVFDPEAGTVKEVESVGTGTAGRAAT